MNDFRENKIPLSVLIPVKNEVLNLKRCLDSIVSWVDEIVIVDSASTDGTQNLAIDYGVKIIQFEYSGGWPKKRQWAMDNYPFRNEWILLLDADESCTKELENEIRNAIKNKNINGYYIPLRLVFLNRVLKYGGFKLYKLNLFRLRYGKFEERLRDQTRQMSDIEVHEHVIVQGKALKLTNALEHRNINSLHRYLEKHNEYSTWEAQVMLRTKKGIVEVTELKENLFGNSQAEVRRWFKNRLFFIPGFSIIMFLYHYVFRFGFLDGKQGFIYCTFQAIQRFQTKVKLYELENQA